MIAHRTVNEIKKSLDDHSFPKSYDKYLRQFLLIRLWAMAAACHKIILRHLNLTSFLRINLKTLPANQAPPRCIRTTETAGL